MYANTLHVLPTAEGDGSFVESSRICTCFASYILRGIKHETNPHNYSYVHTCTRIHSQLNTRMQITHTHIYYILWKREMFVANMHIFTILPQGSCNHKWQFNKDTHTHLYTFTSTQILIHSIKNDEKLIRSMNSVRSECTSCWYATTLTSITLGLVSSTLECMKINLQTWCREQRPKETEVGAKAGVLDNHPV